MRAVHRALCIAFLGGIVSCASFGAFPGIADAQLIWPGEEMATIDGEHLRAYVPAAHAEELRRVVARADQIYGHMLADANYQPRTRLRLLIADWLDAHNGFSFVTPYPLIQVELAPALTESSIFHGGDGFERTLVHELAHQISNDRTHGFRKFLERVFGRILPSDTISLILAYLSTPAHQTMPSFWHEGLGVWAETEYADAASPWGGRGRDPMTHMVWRLDAAAGGIPEVADWRLSYHHWPYGRRVYIYGNAYLRYLEGNATDEASIWQVIAGQSRTWPYFFSRGSKRTLGVKHATLLRQARVALGNEQRANLAKLRAQPVTALERLTPPDLFVGAPAWLPNGDLIFAVVDFHDRPRLHRLAPDGTLVQTDSWGHSLGNVRSRDDVVVYHEYNWRRFSHVRLDTPAGSEAIGHRWLQPDAIATAAGVRVAAIELEGGGRQRLVVLEPGQEAAGARAISTEGIPWSPTFHGEQLAWVETHTAGSRLVTAAGQGGSRRVLVDVAGRIFHPVWSSDGAYLYFCSDSSGVANAYRVTVADGTMVPITNTIGGVTACVPSPDGQTLALIEHDHQGPFVAKLPNDPAAWVRAIPQLPPLWPAPKVTAGQAPGGSARPAGSPRPLPSATDALPEARPYRGLREFRPLFWSPTTFPAPGGGFGVSGLGADPLLTHTLAAGIGSGPIDGDLVGFVGYTSASWPLQWSISAWQGERSLSDQIVVASLAEFDYEERITSVELRLGRGLAGLEQRFFAFASAGHRDYEPLDDTEDLLPTITPISTPALDGNEEYVGFTLGYGSTTFFPTSYAPEDGLNATLEFRHSGFSGDVDRNLAFANASGVWSINRALDQQIVVGVQAGWSDGDRTLQENFRIGGSLSRGLPRGYSDDTEATGRHLFAGSLAFRTPLWRPFRGFSTTPFRFRQVVLELFGDTANVDNDDIAGNSQWFSSVGGELFLGWEFDRVVLRPGVGVARQLDGDRDTTAYVNFGLRF